MQTLKRLNCIIVGLTFLFILSNASGLMAQYHERWEHLGPLTFSSIVPQSPTTLVMTTTDGWLYISSDYGKTWAHHYIDDTLSLDDAKFVDSLHGVLMASDGTMLFTSDGGGHGTDRMFQAAGLAMWRILRRTRLTYAHTVRFGKRPTGAARGHCIQYRGISRIW